jgi:hypothetical protein
MPDFNALMLNLCFGAPALRSRMGKPQNDHNGKYSGTFLQVCKQLGAAVNT